MPGSRHVAAGSVREHKMVLVLRGELRLTAGKAAAQAAHAAVMLVQLAERRDPEGLRAWLSEGQRKIVLVAPTLTDLEAIERDARSRKIPTVWVEDAGFTEVPAGTRTCLGLGPAAAERLDPVTGRLDLL
jgi:peptidyl-tRNA hydrolase, PTH2 family